MSSTEFPQGPHDASGANTCVKKHDLKDRPFLLLRCVRSKKGKQLDSLSPEGESGGPDWTRTSDLSLIKGLL